jgi:transcriptional regulator with XRE-family HTH domain
MYGEALRLVRSFHDMNQSELAAALGISRSYLSEVESEKKTPSLELLQKYASQFDLPLSALIFFSEQIDEPVRDRKMRDLLAGKAISLLQWIEQKRDSKRAA